MISSSKLTQFITQKWMAMPFLVGLVAVSAAVLLVLIVVNPSSETTAGAEPVPPAAKATIEGTDLNRLTLTERAAERLDIQLAEVVDNTIPYAALLYELNGGTFVYTSPEALTFVRAPVVVDHIEGDRVVLVEGPPAGTSVVTVGGAELIGVEFGLGK